jgi:hypothetical protein
MLKIFDKQNNRIIDSVTIYLTPSEAHQLGDFAKQLALHPEDHHAHVTNLDSSVEITIAVYTPENIDQFYVKSRTILQDEIKDD